MRSRLRLFIRQSAVPDVCKILCARGRTARHTTRTHKPKPWNLNLMSVPMQEVLARHVPVRPNEPNRTEYTHETIAYLFSAQEGPTPHCTRS
jgi:hypothetical protein